jgi:hypothetical protein
MVMMFVGAVVLGWRVFCTIPTVQNLRGGSFRSRPNPSRGKDVNDSVKNQQAGCTFRRDNPPGIQWGRLFVVTNCIWPCEKKRQMKKCADRPKMMQETSAGGRPAEPYRQRIQHLQLHPPFKWTFGTPAAYPVYRDYHRQRPSGGKSLCSQLESTPKQQERTRSMVLTPSLI